MSEIDHSLHMREFSPWSEIPTRYAADTADVGHDVDDAWKELGVYGKKFCFSFSFFSPWSLIMKYLPKVLSQAKSGKTKIKGLMKID